MLDYHNEWIYRIGITGGISYLGTQLGKMLGPLIFKYYRKPKLVMELTKQYKGCDPSQREFFAFQILYLSGKFPEGYKPRKAGAGSHEDPTTPPPPPPTSRVKP
jgi:hypothetical protein